MQVLTASYPLAVPQASYSAGTGNGVPSQVRIAPDLSHESAVIRPR
jgi:hypothetical protein